jgi:hypothetical protein
MNVSFAFMPRSANTVWLQSANAIPRCRADRPVPVGFDLYTTVVFKLNENGKPVMPELETQVYASRDRRAYEYATQLSGARTNAAEMMIATLDPVPEIITIEEFQAACLEKIAGSPSNK